MEKENKNRNNKFKSDKSKICSIDNLHPNWKNQELTDEMKITENGKNQQKVSVLRTF